MVRARTRRLWCMVRARTRVKARGRCALKGNRMWALKNHRTCLFGMGGVSEVLALIS